MDVASALVLVTTDPRSGTSRLSQLNTEAVIGGGFLLELIGSERVVLEGSGRRARVVVVDRTPVEDPVVQRAFLHLQGKKPLRPQEAVTRLGRRRGRDAVRAALCDQGLLAERRTKLLGFLPVMRHEVRATGRRDQLIFDVRRVLLGGAEPDAITGPLIGLLHAAGLLKLVVDRTDLKAAKRRAVVVAEGDWASAGVRQAIQASQAAVAAVAAAGATAGSAGAG